MSPEMIAIIGAAIALAAVILPGQHAMRRDIADLAQRMTRLEKDLSERMARLEGFFEGFTSGSRQNPTT